MDIFKLINNAVLDLQASDYQVFERPLKELVNLLNHPELAPANAVLTEGLNLDSFLEESVRTGSGMIGSARLVWPPERPKQLGLVVLLLRKFADDPSGMMQFGHTFCHAGNKLAANVHAVVRQVIIPFQRDYRDYVLAQGRVEPRVIATVSNRVFVVHGHDDAARETVARFLERLGLVAVILHEQVSRGRTVIEKVEEHGDVAFAVVLLTPDDEGRARGSGELMPRARQNVVLELGYFLARLGRDRVCALKRGGVEIPSDYAGVVWTDMDSGGGWRLTLAREMKVVGFDVDLNKAMG